MDFIRHFFTRNFRPGWQTWLTTIAVMIFGLALLIWPGQTTGLILNFIGGVLMFLGAFRIIRYFVRNQQAAMHSMDLGMGITLFVLGLLVYLMKGFLLSLVPTIIGIILLVSGFIKLQTALDFKRMNVYRWQIQLITSCISIVMGVIILVNPFGTALVMTRIIGAAILIEALEDILSLRLFW